MVYLRNKKGKMEVSQLVVILAAIAFLITFLFVATEAKASFLNVDFVSTTSCWLSNGMKCGGGLFSFTPDLCTFEVIEEPVDEEGLASLLRNTWWMYHRAECDFNNVGAEIYPIYSFSVEEELTITDLLIYLSTNNRGDNSDLEDSDLAYIEENTIGNTICFDDGTESLLEDNSFDPGETYFILYYDVQEGKKYDDKLIISTSSDFNLLEPWKEVIFPALDASSIREAGTNVLKYKIPGYRTYIQIKNIATAEKPQKHCIEYEWPLGEIYDENR